MRISNSLAAAAIFSATLTLSPQAAFSGDKMLPAQGGSVERRGGDWSHGARRDWGHRSHKDWRKGWRQADVIEGRRRGRGAGFSGDGALPDFIENLGTFSGSISAVRDRKNGNYFYRDRNRDGGLKILTAPGRSGPTIIGVAPESFEAACDRQGSVCVIKPR